MRCRILGDGHLVVENNQLPPFVPVAERFRLYSIDHGNAAIFITIICGGRLPVCPENIPRRKDRQLIRKIIDRTVLPGDIVEIAAGLTQAISNTGEGDLLFLCICTPRFEWDNYESLE